MTDIQRHIGKEFGAGKPWGPGGWQLKPPGPLRLGGCGFRPEPGSRVVTPAHTQGGGRSVFRFARQRQAYKAAVTVTANHL